MPNVEEASSRGAVLLALESIGNIDALENIRTPKGKRFRPDPKRTAAHREAIKRHRELYDLVVEKH